MVNGISKCIFYISHILVLTLARSQKNFALTFYMKLKCIKKNWNSKEWKLLTDLNLKFCYDVLMFLGDGSIIIKKINQHCKGTKYSPRLGQS